ncbi:MAG TPA: SUMF1/EgtB/PvdO family nonheme iron enzyme [Steroidobacteraceae bacterium]|nr:SUMF1/EgtB/PvdO family nonheme iron enzyme [Steroidobacteraceae bacterium]
MKRLRLLLLPAVFAAVAFGQQRAGGAAADMVYARPGQLVDVGGYRVNLHCMGSGSPTVVFDSGWGDWSPAWSKVQPQVARWTRACSYDRAGTGLSDPGPLPRTSVRIAGELRAALHHAGLAGPYILVASAFGSDNVRTFADLYTREVAGLVFVDADADDLISKALQEESHRSEAGFIPSLIACRNAVAEHRPLPVLPSRSSRPSRVCAERVFFRGFPEAEWSSGLNAEVLQLAKTKVAMYDAYISEMKEMPADELWLRQHRRSFGSVPLRVLTSGNHGVGHLAQKPPDTPQHLEYEKENTQAQGRWLALSSDARQIFVHDSSEYIQFDQPAAVIDAIRDVHDRAENAAKAQQSQPSPRAMETFRDCPDCPQMVVVPAGRFTMGSSAAEKSWAAAHGTTLGSVADEAPQHEVSVPSFAIGKYDVTRGEYAAFVRETGHPAGDGCGADSYSWRKRPELSWENPGFRQTDRDPVVCVSWQDANGYIAWLNGKLRRSSSASNTGPYRLPSESEWEYAARAGTQTRFWWGDDDAATPDHAWYKENAGGTTHPVGMKAANAFGLYDAVGNVWQWTADCYAGSYSGAPASGRANETGVIDPRPKGTHVCMRVDRGGSWFFGPWALRSATRERNPVDFRDTYMGFRVARTL